MSGCTEGSAPEGGPADVSYVPTGIDHYDGNPLIEALPPIHSEDSACWAMSTYPRHQESDRQRPNHIRFHLLERGRMFFVPLTPHLELERRFSKLIRTGYIARNPVRLDYWRTVKAKTQAFEQALATGAVSGLTGGTPSSTAGGLSILGLSGVGKSKAVEAVLRTYPQTIDHRHYRGREFTRRQVVWLKVECSDDGGIKGIAENFFHALDGVLGTRYADLYVRPGRTAHNLTVLMATIAQVHSLGVLVVDEIQNLSYQRSGGHAKTLNFLVELINKIGLPVVLVGTPKAVAVLTSEFRVMRRTSSQGEVIWERLGRGTDWDLFAQALWHYQYVRTPSSLTPDQSDALLFESAGIADLAVKLYLLAQARAICDGTEIITAELLRDVAHDALQRMSPILEAIRSGNFKRLSQRTNVDDVLPLNFEELLEAEVAKPTKKAVPQPSECGGCPAGRPSIALGVAEPTTIRVGEEIKTVALLPQEPGLAAGYDDLKQRGFIADLENW